MQNNIMLINRNYQDINPVLLGREDCAPLQSDGPSVRPYYQIYCIVSGKGRFCCQAKEYRAGAGDLILIPSGAVAFLQADEKAPWEYIRAGFSSSLPLSDVFGRQVIYAPESKRIFEQMLSCRQYGEMAETYICAKVLELLTLLGGGKAVSGARRYVLQAKNIIETQYDKDLSVSALAQELGLERSYFSKIFKEELGVSPQQYLVSYRLEKAAKLMRKQHYTPSLAAAYCGYSDLVNFSKMFKKRFGLSPRHYFNQYKEN